LGRFLQTDPIGYDDGPNIYNYVGSNAINLIDPSGLDGWDDFDLLDFQIDIPPVYVPPLDGDIVVNGSRSGNTFDINNNGTYTVPLCILCTATTSVAPNGDIIVTAKHRSKSGTTLVNAGSFDFDDTSNGFAPSAPQNKPCTDFFASLASSSYKKVEQRRLLEER
jgi:uncharacterized protein RhaS with RHS repeats